MNSNKRDIYFNGEIIVDFSGFNPNKNTVSKNKSYPVQGQHNWVNGEDVPGRYELKYQGLSESGKWIDCPDYVYNNLDDKKRNIVAIPLPTHAPVAELPKEAEGKAKELVDKFEPMCLKYKGAAQKCALICVDEILNCKHGWNKETSSFVAYWQQVRTAINQL